MKTNEEILEKTIRDKILWAEINVKEQEYYKLQKQIDELEQVKKNVNFEVQKRLAEVKEIEEWMNKKKEVKLYYPTLKWKVVITMLSPVIAPFYLFSKFMYEIKSIKIEIIYK